MTSKRRPQGGGNNRTLGGTYTKVRPEKVERGRVVAAQVKAGEKVPLPTGRVIGFLTQAFEKTDLVPETDIYLNVRHGGKGSGKRHPLTRRQAEILQLYADGLHPQEMMVKLKTNRRNISNRVEAIKFSLDAKTLYQAIAIATRAGLVSAKHAPAYEEKGRLEAKPNKLWEREPIGGVLTPTETEVLRLLVDGHTNQQIADIRKIGFETAKEHVKSIINKLGASNRTHVITIAFRTGIVQ